MQVFVILPAAGLGTRMAAGQGSSSAPKQFLALAGVPILVHTLRAFTQVPKVAAIYVAVRGTEKKRLTAQVSEDGSSGKVHVVEGGNTRQDSVANTLHALNCGPDDIILVHDAVRPLIDPAVIARTIEAVEKYNATIIGLPTVNTIKQVERTARSSPRPFLPCRDFDNFCF